MKWLALIFLLPGFAVAQFSFTFSWIDPTERTDGTALDPAAELSGYRMECSGPENAERMVDRAATTADGDRRVYVWTDAVQTGGMYDCRMTAIDTADEESPWSNVVSVPKFAAPSAPTDLRGD